MGATPGVDPELKLVTAITSEVKVAPLSAVVSLTILEPEPAAA